jgi:uncharacterized protein (TIGR03435 family)
MHQMHRAILTACTFLLGCEGAFAQSFEVATIRLCGSDAGGRSGGGKSTPGRLVLNCQTLGDADRSFPGLIAQAYGLFAGGHRNPPWAMPPVEGGPAWLKSDRYEIVAKADGDASPDMMNGPMLQALLEDRFQLKVHRETREIPVYDLTVAKGGPKLRAFKEGSCTHCGANGTMKGSNFLLHGQGVTSDELAKSLAIGLDRPVIDQTGLAGKFDFELEFARDQAMGPAFRDPNQVIPAAADLSTGPSIFTAIQEQLGLKLEPAKGPGEFLVIDSVERPSGN